MQIIYSIGGCVFNGEGIGATAYHAVAGIYRHHLLKRLIVPSYRSSEIDDEFIATVPSNPRGLQRLLGEQYSALIRDSLHDFLASRKIEKCDIFHGWAGMSLWSMREAKKLGAITILDRASSHILTQNRLLQEECQKWGIRKTPIHPLIIKKQLQEYQEADCIFVPSEFAYQSFIENGVEEKKLRLIPFGTETRKIKTGQSTQNSKLQILYVGQLSLRKGVQYLLQAWSSLKLENAELVLVGALDSEFKAVLIRLMSELNQSRVILTGFTNPTPYYQSADIFVFPSTEEGSALVTYEAQAAGLPVITTFNSGSVIRDGIEGIIVPIRDSTAIKEAILKLCRDEGLRKQMSQAAIKRAKEYSWFEYGERVVKAYQEISTEQ